MVVVGNGFAQPSQYTFDASSLHRLNAPDIEVVHQCGNPVQAWLLKFKAGLQGFEGHAVADMTEGRLIEVKTQCIYRAVLWRVQPEDLSVGVNEAAN
ncbi:hypothetical protein D3C85_649010 [compost metagenome]